MELSSYIPAALQSCLARRSTAVLRGASSDESENSFSSYDDDEDWDSDGDGGGGGGGGVGSRLIHHMAMAAPEEEEEEECEKYYPGMLSRRSVRTHVSFKFFAVHFFNVCICICDRECLTILFRVVAKNLLLLLMKINFLLLKARLVRKNGKKPRRWIYSWQI